MRDSMVFYRSFAEAISELDDEDQLAAFWAIVNYGLDAEEPEGKGAAKAVFRMAKPQIDANERRYQNGSKGGRPSQRTNENGNQTITEEKPNRNQTITKAKPNLENKKPNVNENVNENVNVNEKTNTSCPEPEKSAPDSPTAIEFILNDGSMYSVTENDVVNYQQLYPGIDCMAELRKIVGWCDANPKNRKTRAGAKRFVNAWLSRAQDRAPAARPATKKPANQFHNFEQRSYDYDDLLKRINEKGKENEGL